MSQSETAMSGSGAAWVPLGQRERRVVGVLAEKGKTTPEYYPLTVAALVAGCNQKTNRDPITNYDSDDVEETLQSLRKKGAAILVEAGGRVPRWKHTLYEWLKVSKAELAVLIELLLRGPQTAGELRARASRMEPLPDLAALESLLEALVPRGLVVYLSPPGQKRGVVVTHGLYPPEELEKARQAFTAAANGSSEDEPPTASPLIRPAAPFSLQGEGNTIPSPGGRRCPEGADEGRTAAPAWATEIAAVRTELDELRQSVAALAAEIRSLKASLGG